MSEIVREMDRQREREGQREKKRKRKRDRLREININEYVTVKQLFLNIHLPR